MKTVWARLNQPAILPCELGGADVGEGGNWLLEWRRNGTLVFNAYGNEPGYSSPEFQGRLGRSGLLGLTIHSVRAQDQSVYGCSITRFARGEAVGAKELGKLFRLVVHSLPRIFEPLDGTELWVPLNGSARLECLAEGIPSPNIRWKRKLVEAGTSQEGQEELAWEGQCLEICEFSTEKQGAYFCEAENFEGKAMAKVEMRLKRPLRIDRQNASLANKTVAEGSSVFWHCSVEQEQGRGPGQVQFRWSKDGREIGGLEVGLRAHLKGGEFGILRLRRADSGDYVCQASSAPSPAAGGLLEQDRVAVHLNVQYGPAISTLKTRRFHTIASGSAADLDCFVEANPVPVLIKWTKNGRELKEHVEQMKKENHLLSRVHIQRASLDSDAGIYTCEAENSLGASAPFEIQVVVADAPEFTKIPAPLYRVNAGDQVEVQCEGFSEVPLRRLWTKNGESLELSTPKFLLSNVTHNDHGLYQCILVNSVVSVSKEFQVVVENTLPQCASQARVDCHGQNGFSLGWTPGHAGGNFSQLFRIYYRKVDSSGGGIGGTGQRGEGEGQWRLTDFTNHAKTRLDNLEAFSEYEMKLEASNKFGRINCTLPGRHHTCSKLSTPVNFRLEFWDGEHGQSPVLAWHQVEQANKYKLKYRYSGQAQKSYRELAELAGTEFRLPLQRLDLNGSAEFVVQAVKAPFISSEPTQPVLFPPPAPVLPSIGLLLGLLLAGALLAFLFLLLLVVFIKKHGKTRRNIFMTGQRQKVDCLGTSAAGNGSEKAQMQNHFGPNSNLLDSSGPTPPNPLCSISSHCPSSSSLTSAQRCGFGQSIAITRKLFPDNYIPTKMAQFDELEDDSFEHFGQFPSSENTFLGACNGSSVSANCMEMHSEPNWGRPEQLEGAAIKSNSLEMFHGSEGGRESAVDEMLREKYIFDRAEMLDRMEEIRIEQLRREMEAKCERSAA